MSDEPVDPPEGEPQDPEQGKAQWGLVCSFFIDTPGYTPRDRQMFVAGYEFAIVLNHIRHRRTRMIRTIHRENESRVRLAAAQFNRTCTIRPCEEHHDPDGTWSYLTIDPKPE